METTSNGRLVRFGVQRNDSGSYGTFFPAKYESAPKPTSIEHFIGVKEIELARDVTRGDCDREVATLKSAQSEFVVKYYESYFNQKRSTFYIYTEMCSCSLDDILQRNKAEFVYGGASFTLQIPSMFADLDAFVVAYKQIFHGLDFLHSQNIIHRDIKPANIVKSTSGQFKICDFGLAKIIQGSTRHTTAKGSEWYSAPEKRNGGDYDVASDVYSAGVTLLEGLILSCASEAGRFKYNNLDSARNAFQDNELRALIDTMPIFKLPHAMMSRNPSDRPTLKIAINLLNSDNFSDLAEIPAVLVKSERPVFEPGPDKSHYQFADRFFKSNCSPGSEVTKIVDGKVHTICLPNNVDYVFATDSLYFDLTDGTTGYMRMKGDDDIFIDD